MQRRIFYLFLAVVTAWFFGPLLTKSLELLPLNDTSVDRGVAYFKNRSGDFYFEFAFWCIVLYFTLPLLFSFFGFLAPQARRYSTTKLLRRVHHKVALLLLLGVYFAAAVFVLMWGPENRYEIKVNFLMKPYDPMVTIPPKIRFKDIFEEGEIRQGIRDIKGFMQWGGKMTWPLFKATARFKWKAPLIVAVIALILTRKQAQRTASAIHHVIMRFIEEGRFGEGGSGRFAGLFEEWGLMSNHRGIAVFVRCVLCKFPWVAEGVAGVIDEMRKDLSKGEKPELYMGRSLYTPFLNIGLSDDRHMLTVAGSRTGKGATAIIPNLLLWDGSAIVIDPKGTNAAVTAKYRRRMGHRVLLVDPFGIVAKDQTERASFNPLETLNPDADTIREDINVIADALVVPDLEQKEKHWDDGARTVLSGLIGQLITAFENPSLPLLRNLLALPQEQQDELWASMSLNERAGGAARDAATRIIRGIGTNEISGLISNADKHTEWLSGPAIQKALETSTFSFSDLKESPTTIYLILPPKYLSTHNRFLRLFINMAILHMSAGGRSKIPVLMILDEFLALGHMAEVEKALGLMAGYNLILWPFVQDLGRLKDIYKNSVNSFIANSRAVQIFGAADSQTTEYVSKQLGNRSISDLPLGRMQSVPLRSPDEVAKDIVADSHRQYILRAGKAPLVIEKVPYYRGGLIDGAWPGLFHGKYDKDPDHSS